MGLGCGSVENRFRLLREIVEAVTKVRPADQVAVRLSPNGVFNYMGSPDLIGRPRNGWPLADSDQSSRCSGEHAGEGDTDYPAYQPEAPVKSEMALAANVEL